MGVPEGQRPTDAQFVQQLMLSLLGMACFNSERMLEWAAKACDWFDAALMPNPVRDCCLISTNSMYSCWAILYFNMHKTC